MDLMPSTDVGLTQVLISFTCRDDTVEMGIRIFILLGGLVIPWASQSQLFLPGKGGAAFWSSICLQPQDTVI